MNKENITNKITTTSENYSLLQLGEILSETDGHRAIEDAIKIGEMKVDCFWNGFGMENVDCTYQKFERIRIQNEIIQSKKEEMLKQNENNMEYSGVFKKVCDWVEKGYNESGITTGEKVRFLKKKFEIKDEEEVEKKRFNLKDIFKRK